MSYDWFNEQELLQGKEKTKIIIVERKKKLLNIF